MRRLIIALLALVAACGGGGSSTPKFAFGEQCTEDSDCASGACLQGEVAGDFCSQPCTAETDCPLLWQQYESTCGVDALGRDLCQMPCDSGGVACIDDRPVACETLPSREGYCQTCGCDNEGDVCVSATGLCRPPSDVGGPCEDDYGCVTGNCSTYAGVCRVPVGDPCTTDNCDSCATDSGFSWCSRDCSYSTDCNGGYCLGSDAFDIGHCSPACTSFNDPSCPGTCGAALDGGYYCRCEGCTFREELRELGEDCQTDEECVSGSCYTRRECGGVFGDECDYRGACTAACTTDASCGDGLTCAQVACAAGQSEDCGALCLADCDPQAWYACGPGGGCTSLPRVEGGNAEVCDMRIGDGGKCWENKDCLSGRCLQEVCTPVGGLANGSVCTAPSDCASQKCVNGLCRGSAVLGDTCALEADCSVGTCCFDSSSAGVCKQSC